MILNSNSFSVSIKQVIKTLCCIGFALGLVACSILPDKFDETLTWSEKTLYDNGQEALKDKDYTNAAKYFELFEGRFPLNKLAKQALLNTSYSYYKNDDKALASQAVERFIELYPNDEQVDYAYYLRGLIYFNDDLGLLGRFAESSYSERDPQSMKTSYAAFKALVERFPKSKYTPDALDRMRFIVNSLATHDMLIARYYYQRGAYLAAANRAEQVIKEYERAPAIEEALFIAYKSYDALGIKDLKESAYATLLKNFPASKFLDKKDKQDNKNAKSVKK
jgi:outer membrane protein assembly factor BamD